ncbi:CAAX protease self-immunity [Geodermatophilus dictyosporus]|uniref:CAAX protease self-immunity n=1 Tax=Geodermatophilus dictyosporus TaxID=1523247 RepID=A0A1I5PFX1_9ACTN|nr:CPBP family intramembrane glutamic endopeptidase [Geodermatophilus dictyosporus]SFP32984.1 CAAX protease self-immunity [Geodermatophilus dictyosporus]
MSAGSDVRRAAGLVVLLGAWNDVVVPRLPARAYAPVNAAATAALLAAARAGGISWDELGLHPGRLPAGARRGGACAAVVGAGYAAALAVPASRPLLADARVAGLGARDLTARVLVRIPVGTVLWEEVAFRGVLPPVLRRVLPRRWAAAAAAALFGLWHVAPTRQGLALNGLAADPLRRATAVTAACLGTAGVDVLFAALRERSGSLLAPALLHLAANDLGVLAAAVASRGGCAVALRSPAPDWCAPAVA